jgi:hypothetical protein
MSLENEIIDAIYISVHDSVDNSVYDSVYNFVRGSVNSSVWPSVSDFVCKLIRDSNASVWRSVVTEIYEYEFRK